MDFSKDTYDGGLHLNLSGAEKITEYLGEFLRNEYELPDHRSEKELQEIWDQKIILYEREKERQYAELGGN